MLPAWGIDFEKIRGCTEIYGHPVDGTFNVTDFGAKRLKVIPHTRMDEEYFLAVDAVPGVVPPVERDGTLYTDAMFLKDANLDNAIQRDADEIWIIWTVEDEARWRGGFWNHYGHIFETTANGNLKRELDVIEKINYRVHSNDARPGQKHVTVHEIRPDYHIPVEYLFWIRKKKMQQIIEMGREYAREYLVGNGMLEPAAAPSAETGVKFTETMSGYFTPGETDYEAGARKGEESDTTLEFTLTISVGDLERFEQDPEHLAPATGVVRSPLFGGACAVTEGKFNLFRTGAEGTKEMNYELPFTTGQGKRYVLKGFKTIRDDPGADLWSDTTTLMTQVLDQDRGTPVGAGILRISPTQFLRQMTTFRGEGSSSAAESAANLVRFGKLFTGHLWDSYGAHYFQR